MPCAINSASGRAGVGGVSLPRGAAQGGARVLRADQRGLGEGGGSRSEAPSDPPGTSPLPVCKQPLAIDH